MPKNKDEAESLRKMTDENRMIWARVGYRYIYKRLVEGKYFDGLGKTPVESARLAPFREALEILSLENAMQ